MTEEDTFKKLKQIPYSDMRYLWAESSLFNQIYSSPEHYKEYLLVKDEVFEFFNNYGWEPDEFWGIFRNRK